MIAAILSAFNLLSFTTRLAIIGGLALSAVAAYGVWHHTVYAKGYQAALADVARADIRAVARATAYRSAFKECRSAGKSWDQTTGRCQ